MAEVPVISAFRWTAKSEQAALNVARDELNDLEIAGRAGITDRSLRNWKAHPEFAARVESHVTEFRTRVRRRGIAVVENRVGYLQQRHDLMRRLIEERGRAPEMQDVPGGSTGLLVHDVKAIGGGEFARQVDLYEVDTGLLAELRAHEKQAAQELGQWEEKQLVKASGETVVKVLRGVSMDEL